MCVFLNILLNLVKFVSDTVSHGSTETVVGWFPGQKKIILVSVNEEELLPHATLMTVC